LGIHSNLKESGKIFRRGIVKIFRNDQSDVKSSPTCHDDIVTLRAYLFDGRHGNPFVGYLLAKLFHRQAFFTLDEKPYTPS